MSAWRRVVPKTLFGKLALAQIIFGLVAAALFVRIFYLLHAEFHMEAEQLEAAGLAQRLLDEQRRAGAADASGENLIERILERHRAVNPPFDLYWLDSAGHILASSRRPEEVRRDIVDVTPLRGVLQGAAALPVLAVDPATLGDLRPFSVAAEGPRGSRERFLYVVLKGQDDRLSQRTADRYEHQSWLALAFVVIALALMAAVLVQLVILRPFSRLSGEIDRFSRSNFSEWRSDAPIRSKRADDELDRMHWHFDVMARRIVALVREFKDEDRRMREMLAAMSHDLRTPLTIMRGNIETLQLKIGTLPPAERDRILAALGSAAESLRFLTDSMFELAKLENPGYRLRREAFSLAELANDVALKFAFRARDCGFQIDVQGLECGATVIADIALMERILDNLVENALKHAVGGNRVIIGLRRRAHQVELSVSDNGMGYGLDAALHCPAAAQASTTAEREGKGAGLGLAIVRKILDLHGAELIVESARERGCRFAFWLPVETLVPGNRPNAGAEGSSKV